MRRLQARRPDATLEVLSAQPDETARAYGVEATQRADLAAVQRAVSRADAVLSGGGGLLQNATSLKSLIYYAGIVRSAVRGGKKAMIFAQSIGPLDFWGRLVVREFCRGLPRATVRDDRSLVLLASLLPDTPIERTADPVFLIERGEDIDLGYEGLGPQSDPLAVVCVRRWDGAEATAAAVAAAVDRLAERHGLNVAFLPIGGEADAEASTAIIRRCRTAPTLLPGCDLAHTAAIIARAKFAIGMRLHALILAARFGVPFLALPYDPKVAALCEDLEYPFPPLWQPGARGLPDVAGVEALVDRAWSERDALAGHLREGTERMRVLAERNFDVLDELVGH